MVATQARLKIIERLLMNPKQRILYRLQRSNFLHTHGDTSNSEIEIGKLSNYKISGTIDNRLLRDINVLYNSFGNKIEEPKNRRGGFSINLPKSLANQPKSPNNRP